MANFRVIIVGGGLGGLTLANCLQHANIDFVLLEGREKLGLHIGAGIGIDPAASRILDQLGVYSDLEGTFVGTAPTKSNVLRDVHGKINVEGWDPALLAARLESIIFFLGFPAFI
jgi:2-polyprenyl-6-methoxyphenol hydroxylase-like FAD-dependent oxidoreductase